MRREPSLMAGALNDPRPEPLCFSLLINGWSAYVRAHYIEDIEKILQRRRIELSVASYRCL